MPLSGGTFERYTCMKNPLDGILVVCGGKNLLDDELPGPSHNNRIIAEVRVFVKNAGVFFVETDGIFDLRTVRRSQHQGAPP